MPRNGSGVFSLPAGYLAVTGQTIQASQHNTPLEDIAADLNANLAGRLVTPTGGTTARTLADKLGDVLSVADVSTLASAVQSLDGRKVHVPAGAYTVAPLIPAAGTSVYLSGEGDGTAITLAAQGGAGAHYAIGRSDGNVDRLTIEELRFDLALDAAATNGVNLLRWNNDHTTLRGVVSNANIVIDQVTGNRNGIASIATLSPGSSAAGLRIIECDFENYFYGFLKANTTVSTERDITIAFSTFAEFGTVALLFNSPASGSLIENVLILGNTLGANTSRQPFGSSVGFPHRGSFAGHVEDTRLIGNHAKGNGGEFFRAEEAARRSIWLGNTAKLNGKDGIEIIPNNISGTIYTPRYFVVGDNVLENTGLVSANTLGWGIGLHVYTDVSGHANAECINESTIHDNIASGWKWNLQVHQGAQRNLIHHNIVDGKDAAGSVGIRTYHPSLGIDDTLIASCETAVLADRGGLIGKLHLRSSHSAIPDAAVITSSGSPLATTGWTWETGLFDLAASGDPVVPTVIALLPIGEMISGKIALSVSSGGDADGPDAFSGWSREIMDIDWDGTTLTLSNKKRKTFGAVISSNTPFVETGGQLAVRVVNGSASTVARTRVQISFTGLHVFNEGA